MTYDFTPLFRTAIGFDRLARLADTLPQDASSYPPYNIEKTGEEPYRLTLAVAGFSADDIELTVKDNALLVAGRVTEEAAKPRRVTINTQSAAKTIEAPAELPKAA